LKKNTFKRKVEDLTHYFGSLHLKFELKNLGYLPRWLVLMIDLSIVMVSGVLTFFLLNGMNLEFVKQEYLFQSIVYYTIVHLFFFRLFRTYSGIIRHSSFIDALKLFFAQFCSLAVLSVINFTYLMTISEKLYLNTGVLINFILSFCLLFLYRVIVKQTFDKYIFTAQTKNLTKALIFGTDANAIAVANALKSESPKRFKLIGFIDKMSQNNTKRILNLPIFQLKKNVQVLMRIHKAEALIIADKSLSKLERSELVEQCISYNFKVFTIPLVTNWEDETEISKNIKTFEITDLLERKPIVLDNQSISMQLHNKVVLITGAAGSIGSEIVRQVLQFNPDHILLLDQAETPLHHLMLEISNPEINVKMTPIMADVRNYEYIEKIFKLYKPSVVYHAAAYKHVPLMEENPAQAIFTNVMGTKNVADLSQKYNVDRFVMVSTDKAVNPSNVMGASKRIAEMYVQSMHFKHRKIRSENYTKFITTRFGNVLGSNGSVVPLFTKQINEGGPITITHPDIIRYFMTIPEACQLVLEAGIMGKGGEIFIFDMGEPVKIIDLAYKMIKLAGLVPEKDIKIKIVGLRPGEKLYEELLNGHAKNLPTHHEKIMIAEEVCDEFDIVSDQIEDLIISSQMNNPNQIVSKMKKIVPEYKSMNSIFEQLDHDTIKINF
jgi:FlaA1/EpsC-like NDP-sugar epimerase